MSTISPGRRLFGRLALACGVLLPLLAGCLPGGSAGERLYRRHCDTCHGVDGGGNAFYRSDEGVNLLDDAWRYGGDPSEIEYSLLNEEIPKHTKWDFTSQERRQLVDHVLALRRELR